MYFSRNSARELQSSMAWHRIMHDEVVLGNGRNYNGTTGLFTTTQTGLNLVTTCIWRASAATTTIIQLQFKQNAPWLVHSKTVDYNVHLTRQIY